MARVWQKYPRPSCSLLATRWQFMDRHDEWRVEEGLSAKCQRRGHELSDWTRSFLRQSEEMSNFVQPHDGGDITIARLLSAASLKRRIALWGRHEFVSTGLPSH